MTEAPSRPAEIQARGWGWRHAGRRAWALAGLDLVIRPGERVLLLGPSGSGKSTLLAALAGVLGGDDDGERMGRLTVGGVDPRDARGTAGMVLQDPESQVIMSRVGDDVAFGCENLGVPADRIWPRVREALDAVGLALPLEHPTEALSGGQKQRLALAGALAMRPGLLLLDEPTANIDPEGVGELRDAVRSALDRTGSTAVIVEHRVDVWRDVVDRIVVLDGEGRLIADGDPSLVLADRGDSLAAAGVWVPGRDPVIAPLAGPAASPELLRADALRLARVPGATLPGTIDTSVAAGEALALTGPNGSGKTTLALTLGGLLPPAGGELRATGELSRGLDARPIHWRSRELLTRIGTVFQAPEHQFLAATVRDELSLAPRTLGLGDREVTARVDDLLVRLDLTRVALANPFTLSGGQKRRLSVAAVLSADPRVLVLDEPTFGQDARTWATLVDLLEERRAAGTAIIAATHDARFVSALRSRELALGAVRA